jgi:hypothetical protein
MSNEELFVAIHKSKRRLNIRDDPEGLSSTGSLGFLTKAQQHQATGTRHSWSPESQKVPEVSFLVQFKFARPNNDYIIIMILVL